MGFLLIGQGTGIPSAVLFLLFIYEQNRILLVVNVVVAAAIETDSDSIAIIQVKQ